MASAPEGALDVPSRIERHRTDDADRSVLSPSDLQRVTARVPWSVDHTVVFRDGETFYLVRTPTPDAPTMGSLHEAPFHLDEDEPVVVVTPHPDAVEITQTRHESVSFTDLEHVPAVSGTDGRVD